MNKSAGLGNYVAERRKALALTQTDLAKSLGYTTQGISKFESGDSQISILVLPKLANLLNESLDDLIAEKKNPDPLSAPNPQVDNANLVTNLIALRSQHNYSQEKEAALLGVSKRSIINYEQGEGYLPLDALKKLLKIYKISAKTFYFDKISPINVSKIHYRDRRVHFLPLWIALGVLGGVGLIVGCTSPLWLSKEKQNAQEGSSSGLTSSGSSSNSPSNSSDSKASSSAVSSPTSTVSSSSTTTDEDPDLSPYLPGLKELFVQTATGIAGAVSLQPGTTAITFFSGSFQFTKEKLGTYTFDFYLENAPEGVSITPDSKIFDQANLAIGASVANQSKFSVGIEAYATDHPDAKVKGTILNVNVLNETSGADLSSDFPDLKAIDLLIDGIDGNSQLKPGSHPLSVISSPVNYFKEHNTTVSIDLAVAWDGVEVTNNVLTIADYVSNEISSLFRITLTNPQGKTYVDQNHKYNVVNPTGEPDSQNFPGILSIDMRIQGNHTATLPIGDTIADVTIVTSSRCRLSLVPGDFFFTGSQYPQQTGIPNVGSSTTGTDLTKCIITVPAGMPDQFLLTVNFSLLRISKSANLSFPTPLYLTISNPSSSSSSSNS